MNANSIWAKGGNAAIVAMAAALAVAFLFQPQALWAQEHGDSAPVDRASSAAVGLPQAMDVDVVLRTSVESVSVGDSIELVLEATHPGQLQALVPVLDKTWGDLEIRNQSPASTVVNEDGTATTTQTIEAVLFTPGNFQTPTLAVTFSDVDGNLSRADAAPLAVSVASLLMEGDTTLRDIKGQATLPIPAAWPLPLVGGLLALAVASLSGYWLYRRLARRSAADNRTPEQVAADELDRIRGLNYPASERYKEHYSAVTDCLRAYVERQYGLPATDRTTAELTGMLCNTSMAVEHVQAFAYLFEEADLVKFAKFTPGPGAANNLILHAHTLVSASAADLAAAQAATAETTDADSLTSTAAAGAA